MAIHPSAIISDKAIIGDNVDIGAYAIIGEAKIGDGTHIHPHVIIADGIEIGRAVEVFPGAFLGKEPKGAGAVARKPEFVKRIQIDDECSIGPNVVIYYDVDIGSNTLLGDGASIREKCKIGSKCIISRYVTVNYETTIGDRTKIMDSTHITGRATIGNDVFISTLVGTTNDNHIHKAYGEHIQGPIIENKVIIGVGASLLPNIRLGENCVVAAGAVVTKNVDAGTLVAGIPARFVRKLEAL